MISFLNFKFLPTRTSRSTGSHHLDVSTPAIHRPVRGYLPVLATVGPNLKEDKMLITHFGRLACLFKFDSRRKAFRLGKASLSQT